MNRTVNQLVNALHLDPKREAAVRKIIENAGGVNDSTPVVNEVSGNELIPISVDGENKAVSAAALVKGAKEVYYIDMDNLSNFTPNDYKNLEKAINDHKLIYITSKLEINNKLEIISSEFIPISIDKTLAEVHFITGVIMIHDPSIVDIDVDINMISIFYHYLYFYEDGNFNSRMATINIDTDGDGTKFLSDDGTYKEVSGGSEPVIIEYPLEGTEVVTLTDEQINAARNSNIKIKSFDSTLNITIIATPLDCSFNDTHVLINTRINASDEIIDQKFIIDIANKTITRQ